MGAKELATQETEAKLHEFSRGHESGVRDAISFMFNNMPQVEKVARRASIEAVVNLVNSGRGGRS